MAENKKHKALSNKLVSYINSLAKEEIIVNSGDFLFKEGDDREYLYFVAEGEIQIKKGNSILLQQSKDELVGLANVFDSTTYAYSAISTKTSKIKRVLVSDFLAFVQKQKDISTDMILYISSLLNRMDLGGV